MRLPRSVARATLIVALALVAAPGIVGSRVPSSDFQPDPAQLREVVVPTAGDVSTTSFDPMVANQSAGRVDGTGALVELHAARDPGVGFGPGVALPAPSPVVVPRWTRSEVSFYGPGFYGKRTACGLALTTTLVGVAHRTLPCGTLVTFRNPATGFVLTMPVVDRGPYVKGRDWDLTGGACTFLDFCHTGLLYWHIGV